ncbi:aminotransferase class V-fold PLP-dependent enzyme [Cellulomonas hominis]
MLPRLHAAADAVAGLLGAEPGSVALVENTTEGAAAVAASVPLGPGDAVAMLDVEYSSVIRMWQERCRVTGAAFELLHLPLPADTSSVLEALEAADSRTSVLVLSTVTSSSALLMPVEGVARWCASRGITLLVDGARVVGQLAGGAPLTGVAAMFGSLHKWLPVPRSVGYLWLCPELRPAVRPAAVSLSWDAEDLVERFGWRGTWDPAPGLGVVRAVEEHTGWLAAGEIATAEALAVEASDVLGAVGLVPTGDASLLPPRMRAFLCPGVELGALRRALDEAGIRVWTGAGADGATILRVATHVYSDSDDLQAVARAVATTGLTTPARTAPSSTRAPGA